MASSAVVAPSWRSLPRLCGLHFSNQLELIQPQIMTFVHDIRVRLPNGNGSRALCHFLGHDWYPPETFTGHADCAVLGTSSMIILRCSSDEAASKAAVLSIFTSLDLRSVVRCGDSGELS